MRVIDSSAWIEWLIDTPIGIKLNSEFPKRNRIVVPTIVQFEMQKWLSRQDSAAAAQRFIAFTDRCVVVALDTSVAVHAAEVALQYKLSAADAIIYTTALAHEADLLTCDAHFKELPGVIYIAKLPH